MSKVVLPGFGDTQLELAHDVQDGVDSYQARRLLQGEEGSALWARLPLPQLPLYSLRFLEPASQPS